MKYLNKNSKKISLTLSINTFTSLTIKLYIEYKNYVVGMDLQTFHVEYSTSTKVYLQNIKIIQFFVDFELTLSFIN